MYVVTPVQRVSAVLDALGAASYPAFVRQTFATFLLCQPLSQGRSG